MLSASRTISIGPETPSTATSPLVVGSDWRRYRYPAAVAAAVSTRMSASTLTRKRRMKGIIVEQGSCRVPIADSRLGKEQLKPTLDRLYESFNYPDSATDPIQIVRRWQSPEDREIVGLCAAALAFGRVSSVLQSIERLLAVMGGQPAVYVREFVPGRDGGAF